MTAVWDISEYRLIDDISITGYIIRRIISEHFSTEISASIFSIYFVSTKRVFFVVGKPDGRRRSSPDRQLPLHRGDHQHPSMAVVDGELCSARQVPGIWCGRRCVLLTSNIVHKFSPKYLKMTPYGTLNSQKIIYDFGEFKTFCIFYFLRYFSCILMFSEVFIYSIKPKLLIPSVKTSL